MQIRIARVKIEQKKEELQALRETAGIREQPDGERVKSSSSQAGCANVAIRLMQLEGDITKRIVEYYKLENRIVDMIHSLENHLYIDILFRRYVKNEAFEEIAGEMGYTFRHTTRLHGEALRAFQIVMKKNKDVL